MIASTPPVRWFGCLAGTALAALMACDAGALVQSAPPPPPEDLFGYDRSAPLQYEEVPTGSPDATLDVFRISYASPGGGRVTGFLTVPKVAGRYPGVVVMHGLPGTAEGAMTSQGLAIAARGAIVVAIDAPWARRGGLPDLTVRDSVEQVQLIKDLQRAVDLLVSRPDVDVGRVAYVGGSYGGAMGALFVGVEHRLKAAVLFVPDGGLVAHFTNADGTATGPLATLSAAEQSRWLAAMRPIEPINFIAMAAGTPLLFQNGRQDQLVTVEDAEALHAAAPAPKTIQWYDAGHGLTAEARSARLAWLAEQIGISPD